MKNYIIILICLSLLLCGCQAAGNNTGTEPTVAPTVAPTEEPTQEPTQELTAAPTEPPLPAGPIDVEVFEAANVYIFDVEKAYALDHTSFAISGLLHTQEQIMQFLTDRLGEGYQFDSESKLDLTPYDEAFFESNSIVVILDYYIGMPLYFDYYTDGISREEDGSYRGLVSLEKRYNGGTWSNNVSVGFLVMKDVTDDAVVQLQLIDSFYNKISEVTS